LGTHGSRGQHTPLPAPRRISLLTAPTRQQHRKVKAVDPAIAIQIGELRGRTGSIRGRAGPLTEQHAEVHAADVSVPVEIPVISGRIWMPLMPDWIRPPKSPECSPMTPLVTCAVNGNA